MFFLLAAGTFAAMAIFAIRTTSRRELYFYHGLMMLATAWMYVIMDSHLMPAGSSTQPDMSMPGMDVSAMNMPARNSATWSSAVGWFGAVGFTAAAIFWTYRYVLDRRRKTAPRRSLGDLGQAMMAAGMAIFFLATLFPI